MLEKWHCVLFFIWTCRVQQLKAWTDFTVAIGGLWVYEQTRCLFVLYLYTFIVGLDKIENTLVKIRCNWIWIKKWSNFSLKLRSKADVFVDVPHRISIPPYAGKKFICQNKTAFHKRSSKKKKEPKEKTQTHMIVHLYLNISHPRLKLIVNSLPKSFPISCLSFFSL